jgi:acyl-CoA thioesterase-1
VRIESISIWGDSIGKGIVFDEARGRYAICRDNYAFKLKQEGVPVENHSVMGFTVCQAIEKMQEKDMRPGGVAAIEFGGNDCDLDWKAVSEAPDMQHEARTPLHLFKDALAGMARRVRAFDMRPVLVVPPPIDAEKYFAWVSKNLNPKAILKYLGDVQHIYRWQERYALAVAEVGMKLNCTVLNLRDAFLAARDFKALLCVDGIHPSHSGHALIWKEVDALMASAGR